MAQRTTSRRSAARGGNSRSGREETTERRQAGRSGSAQRSRSRGADEARPLQKARLEDNDTERTYREYVRREQEEKAGPPDVLLDVPELRVDLIHLDLEDLDAHVALKANVLNLVKLAVGLDVHLSRITLDIKGVEAQVLLKARLDHVTAIVDRLMTTLDRNPELIDGLSRAAEQAGEGVERVGADAGQAVGQVGSQAGQAAGDLGSQAGQSAGGLGSQVGQAAHEVMSDAQQAIHGATQQAQGLNGGVPGAVGPGLVAKQMAKTVAREIKHAASDEARDLGQAATRKVLKLGERREQRRADKLRRAAERAAEEYEATPAAERIADEFGIDLSELEGTGTEGRITVRDVECAVR
jgi:e3 binding domain